MFLINFSIEPILINVSFHLIVKLQTSLDRVADEIEIENIRPEQFRYLALPLLNVLVNFHVDNPLRCFKTSV